MRLFCFGYGYCAESLVRRLSSRDVVAAGTRTTLPETPEPGVELVAYKGDGPSADVRRLLAGTTHAGDVGEEDIVKTLHRRENVSHRAHDVDRLCSVGKFLT